MAPNLKPVYNSRADALQDILSDGMTLMVGGFGLCGIPEALISGLEELKASGLTCISNNAGGDGVGLGRLLRTRRIRRMISSYIGENREFERQYMAGELELDFCPQCEFALTLSFLPSNAS